MKHEKYQEMELGQNEPFVGLDLLRFKDLGWKIST